MNKQGRLRGSGVAVSRLKRHVYFWSVLCFVLLVVTIAGVFVVKRHVLTRVRFVMDGPHISQEALQRVVREHAPYPFFSTQLDILQRALAGLPWVARVRLERAWPDTLVIRLWERQPVARWGSDALLDAQAQLFRPEDVRVIQNVPILRGPEKTQRQVWRIYSLFQRQLLDIDPSLKITSLRLSDRLAWRVTLNHRVVVLLGATDIEKKWVRFWRLYPQLLRSNRGHIKRVDLRYRYGLAILWG